MVFGVAHNSCDAIPTTLEAVGAVADIIEINVVSLDLKESSGAFVALLLEFLDRHRGGRPIMVVSSDSNVIPVLAERGPETLRFLGIADEPSLVRPQGDDQLAGLIDGVSIRHTLLNEERAAWLEDRRRLTLAWTINDLKRLNELVELGVDAVTTDNLAIMKLLGGQQRGERRLARPWPIPQKLDAAASRISAPTHGCGSSCRSICWGRRGGVPMWTLPSCGWGT